MEAIILFSMVLALLFVGVPVGLALGLSSITFVAFIADGEKMSAVAISLFGTGQHSTLLAIPFFIIASAFMSTGGVARRLIDLAIASVGHLRGGLAMASVLACMMFAALSGSSPATVVAIGSIAITGMCKVGYSKDFAAGIVANAGTLGILIPPSIVMVVYAAATNVSVGRMFLGGVIPGLLAGGMLMLAIYITARVKNLPAEPWAGFDRLLRCGKSAWWGIFLIVIIMGGIYGGSFTPTEAAVVASAYAILVALFVYRDMGPLKGMPWVEKTDSPEARLGFSATAYGVSFFVVWMSIAYFAADKIEGFSVSLRLIIGVAIAIMVTLFYGVIRKGSLSLSKALQQSLAIWGRNLFLIVRKLLPSFFHNETRGVMLDGTKTTIMLMFIIANALLFAHTLSAERIPQMITEWMLDSGFSWFTFLLMVNVILLIGGQFMEPSGLLVIVAPVVFPIAIELGVDPIHLGIMMVVNMEIGMITPPVGLNLFVTSGITGMSLARVVKAALPFVGVLFIFLILVTYIEPISTWLPTLMMGPEIVVK